MLLGARQFFERRGAPVPPLPYDAEVEYLESTGTQWINTGYAVTTQNVRIVSRYYFTAWNNFSTVWGANLPGDTNWMANQWGGQWWFGTTRGQFSGSQPIVVTDVEWNINNGIVSGTVGATSYSGTYSGSVVSGYPIYLFAINDGGQARRYGDSFCKLFKFQLYENGVLVRDFIPVRFTNELGQSEGAMYDRVSGALFRNAGTGAFVVGRDINPISARSYVNDGLIAMWDGIENAGWGVHDAAATTWKDLIGSVDLMVNSNTTWFNDALGSASRLVDGVAYSSSYISSIGTIEACFDLSSESDNGSGRGLVCNTNSRAIMGNSLLGIRSRGEASVMMQESAGRLITAFNTSVVYGQTSSADLIYFNGAAQQTVSSSGNWGLLNRIRIGSNGGSTNTAIIGKCHCVRIYSRALTAAEVAANYAIDKARFNLP